jgi:hypothetical protein
MKESLIPTYLRWAYPFLALILVIYLGLRANTVPLVHDEGATFFFYIQTGKFWFYNAHWDANNHVLNSLLTWLSYRFFGDSPFALRLPNVLSFVVFLFYTWKLGTRYLSGFQQHGFILAMWFCHIYFEHFGYTRGYGMSFAFLSAALYYLIDFGANRKVLSLLLTLFFMQLALFANLTLLPLGTVITVWVSVLFLLSWKQNQMSHRALGLLAVFLSLGAIAFFAVFSFELKARDLLYYGGQEGLIADTLQSVAMGLFRVDNWWAGMALLVVILLAVVALPVQVIQRGILQTMQSAYGIFAGLLTIILLSIIAMNVLLGVNFPTYRTALYIFPLLVGALAFWPDLSKYFRPSYLLPLLLVLFVFQSNLSYAWYWRWERISPEMYKTALSKIAKTEYPPLTGGYHLLGLRWALYGYHETQKMGNWNRDGYPSIIPDVQVLFAQDVDDKWKQYYTEVGSDLESGFPLYIRNTPCPRVSVLTQTLGPFNIGADEEYKDLLIADNPNNTAHMIGLTMELEATMQHQELFLAFSSSDSANGNIAYQAMPLHWHYDDLRSTKIAAALFLTKPDIPAVQLKAYLWNLGKQPFTVKSAKIELLELYPEGLPEPVKTEVE